MAADLINTGPGFSSFVKKQNKVRTSPSTSVVVTSASFTIPVATIDANEAIDINNSFGATAVVSLAAPTGNVKKDILLSVDNGSFNFTIGTNYTAKAGMCVVARYNGSSWRFFASENSKLDRFSRHNATPASPSASTWQTIVSIDASSGNVTSVVPIVASINSGQEIIFKRKDNSTNTVRIVPSPGQTLDGETDSSGIYLFSKNESIKILSNGSDGSDIISDNRGSVGQSRGFCSVYGGTQSTGLSVGSPVVFTTLSASNGSSITATLATGQFLLKAGRTYRGFGGIPSANFSVEAAAVGAAWFIVGGAALGPGRQGNNFNQINGNQNNSANNIFFEYTPAVDTLVRLQFTNTTNVTSIVGAYAFIEELTTPANVINTVDYIHAVPTASFAAATNTVARFNSVLNGNIPLNTSTWNFSLIAGKTYELEAMLSIANSDGAYATFQWHDSLGNPLGNIGSNISAGYASLSIQPESSVPAKAFYTPTANVTVHVKILYGNGTVGLGTNRATSYAIIKQTGSSAATTFLGATSTVNGIQGVVPAPLAGQENAILKNNGWQNIESGTQVEVPTEANFHQFTINLSRGGVFFVSGKVNMYGGSTAGFAGNVQINSVIVQNISSKGTTIANQWVPVPFSATVPLAAGTHTLRIQYTSGGGALDRPSFAWFVI